MSSLPAPELNNAPGILDFRAHLNRIRSYEFGTLLVSNAVLAVISVLSISGFVFVGYELKQAAAQLASFKPFIIRVNEAGKAEALYFHDFSKAPGRPEMVRELSDFTTHFYTRTKGQIDAYWNSKYLLSQALMVQTYQEDQQAGWVKKVETGAGETNEVVVNRVNLVSLAAQGGVAYVDFDRVYDTDGTPNGRRETDTAFYRFTFAPKITGKMLQYNPLGIVITEINVTEDLH